MDILSVGLILGSIGIVIWFFWRKKQKSWQWYEPKDDTYKQPCDCCDYITLPERGEYLICPICFWEDDGFRFQIPDNKSNCNYGNTLREARKNFERYGACHESLVKRSLPKEQWSSFKRIKRQLE